MELGPLADVYKVTEMIFSSMSAVILNTTAYSVLPPEPGYRYAPGNPKPGLFLMRGCLWQSL